MYMEQYSEQVLHPGGGFAISVRTGVTVCEYPSAAQADIQGLYAEGTVDDSCVATTIIMTVVADMIAKSNGLQQM